MKKYILILQILFVSQAFAKINIIWSKQVSSQVQKQIKNYLAPFDKDNELEIILNDDNKISKEQLSLLGAESFIIQIEKEEDKTKVYVAANGVAKDFHKHHQKKKLGNLGMHFALFHLMEELGFSFLHPLEPTIPQELKQLEAKTIKESPRWKNRVIHLHTMHPLELTNLLNGWGKGSWKDEKGWKSQLKHWRVYMQWLLANKQNSVQWVMLEKLQWAQFALSKNRQDRIKQIVNIAHEYGIYVGIDAAIALEQQNAFRLIHKFGNRKTELEDMHTRIDYLMETGIDYLSTEMGSSEFTNPGDDVMLLWMNDFTDYLATKWKAESDIKIHVTKNQKAHAYRDPVTGQYPSNFNFLIHYADPRLTALIHTVQHYSLKDPAPTYHRKNFKSMFEFMKVEAGRRKILWYPETAYWVSFDVDVPLFLPVYAHRRIADLRQIALAEDRGELGVGKHKGSKIQGQLIFSSGWEWGYWLNDVAAARAAWNPHHNEANTNDSLQKILEQSLKNIDSNSHLAQFLTTYADMQKELLIYGRLPGVLKAPRRIKKLSGQAYLQGWESWDDINTFAAGIPFLKIQLKTQPDRYSPKFIKKDRNRNLYFNKLQPLLHTMYDQFEKQKLAFLKLPLNFDLKLVDEIFDGLKITALRAGQVFTLYESTTFDRGDFKQRREQKRYYYRAHAMLKEAKKIIRKRESEYRVDFDLIGAWGDNATVYKYGYLWTVHSLSYWYRDENKFVKRDKTCAHNIVDPIMNISYEGRENERLMNILARVKRAPLTAWLEGCMSRPEKEPVYRSYILESWAPNKF